MIVLGMYNKVRSHSASPALEEMALTLSFSCCRFPSCKVCEMLPGI